MLVLFCLLFYVVVVCCLLIYIYYRSIVVLFVPGVHGFVVVSTSEIIGGMKEGISRGNFVSVPVLWSLLLLRAVFAGFLCLVLDNHNHTHTQHSHTLPVVI